jgi:hypothetical protein
MELRFQCVMALEFWQTPGCWQVNLPQQSSLRRRERAVEKGRKFHTILIQILFLYTDSSFDWR